MDGDKLNKTPETPETPENRDPTPPRREGDANFEVSSLSEVKDENGHGIFHMTTRFKWILALSLLILLLSALLVYSAHKTTLPAELWQSALWIVCGLLSIYSVVRKSLLTLILNLILFFVVSLMPVWQSPPGDILSGFKVYFLAMFELFFGE